MSVARALGLVTTAKRLETLAQLDVVRSLGCDRAQGYAFGEPWAASENAAIVKKASSGAAAATAGDEGMPLAARSEEQEPLLLAADRAALVSEGQEPQILHAILLDVSETGMQLRLAEPANMGDEIWLEFALDGPTTLKARVTVVDITPMGQTFWVGASYRPAHGSEQSIAARFRELAAERPRATVEEPAASPRRSSIPTDPLGNPREWRAALLARIAEHPDWDEERVYEAGLDAGLWERDGDYKSHRDRNRKRVVRLRRSASKLAAAAAPDVRAKAS